ncbi:MAG: cobalamin-dependent protein [Oligoflexia bacterium]|nr:cobalamin-dependent protein [Oligoflexia bacterium]
MKKNIKEGKNTKNKSEKNISELIKPYGDTLNDGVIQLSFTLPIEYSAKAKKAAEVYVKKLNFDEVQVTHAHKIAHNFTYFVVYAKANATLDYSTVQASEVTTAEMDFYQINDLIKNKLNRPLVVVGATIGDDAHTVGIDAIMNMKGYNQNYGLERYPEIRAFNMGAQVSIEELLKKGIEMDADAILVSQTVTQKDAHIRNFTAFIELLEAENLRKKFLLVAGGPRISNDLAIELGYEAGFGSGTLPSQVASFLITKILDKKGISFEHKNTSNTNTNTNNTNTNTNTYYQDGE